MMYALEKLHIIQFIFNFFASVLSITQSAYLSLSLTDLALILKLKVTETLIYAMTFHAFSFSCDRRLNLYG